MTVTVPKSIKTGIKKKVYYKPYFIKYGKP